MSIPIRAGDDEDSFRSLGLFESLLLLIVLCVAAVIIGLLTLATWLVRAVIGVSEDPNAGPYRQVR